LLRPVYTIWRDVFQKGGVLIWGTNGMGKISEDWPEGGRKNRARVKWVEKRRREHTRGVIKGGGQ